MWTVWKGKNGKVLAAGTAVDKQRQVVGGADGDGKRAGKRREGEKERPGKGGGRFLLLWTTGCWGAGVLGSRDVRYLPTVGKEGRRQVRMLGAGAGAGVECLC